jgi:Raf kinase inhibitor-like YbhB/YbcL family protein
MGGDLSLTSPALEPEGWIHDRLTRNGGNVQPERHIDGVPEGTVELKLIYHDPDALLPFGITHWTLYGISRDTGAIAGNSTDGLRSDANDFGENRYSGPQPPVAHGPHHYSFWIHAPDIRVGGSRR